MNFENTVIDSPFNHDRGMDIALTEASKAYQAEEVPVGAVLISSDGTILSAAHNRTISLSDPTAHAEILVLRQAGHRIQNYRLLNTTLYVTVEPCLMCMGAIIHARVGKLVFGTVDSRWGAAGSLYDFSTDLRLNHRLEVISGIRQSECREMMQRFFRERRALSTG
jgi:tRNA(adenine34) deaminase